MQIETIYRARELNSDEWVEGELLYGMIHNFVDTSNNGVPSFHSLVNAIDPSTIAIHFTNSNMEDIDGKKIFASLSSDGNGGDIITHGNTNDFRDGLEDDIAMFSPGSGFKGVFWWKGWKPKVTGIHATENEIENET